MIATEKAAPIPAEVLALATTIANEMRQANTLYGAEQRIARAIMQDRADRASQEERIREDERAALDLISSYRQEVNAHDFAMRKALEHVRSHFPGAAAEFDAVYEPELRARLRGASS